MTASNIKLVYLDQSFLSSACLESSQTELNILNKIICLKNDQKARVIISEIHSRETSGISEEYLENSKKLWRFQNTLAEGNIATDVDSVFVAQQRRAIVNNNELSFPISDIGLKELNLNKSLIRIQLNNLWLQKIHLSEIQDKKLLNETIRGIFSRQLIDASKFENIVDCLTYIRELWSKDFKGGIDNWIAYNDQLLTMKKDIINGRIPNFKGLIKTTPFFQLVKNIFDGQDNINASLQWSEQLKDTDNLCAILKIRSAFEAELLWKLKSNSSSINSRKFHSKYGQSRQSDIDHISAYVPYVDIFTTDNDMRNLCNNTLIANELNKFPCKIFSKNNYNELDSLLDDITNAA